MFKKNQAGVSLLEMVLGIALMGIIAGGIIVLFAKQIRDIRSLTTSSKMTVLLEASKEYVKDNFGELQEDLAAVSNSQDLGSISIDIQTDLIDNNYLNSNFDSTTSWDTTLYVGISFIGKDDIIQVAVLNENLDPTSVTDQNQIAFKIKDGQGAIWYNGSGINICSTGSTCVKGMNNQWEMKSVNIIYSNAFGSDAPANNTTTSMAIAFIDGKIAYNKSLYRNPIADHLDENTINSNINITTNMKTDKDEITNYDGTKSKAQTIFFNALTNTDIDSDELNDFTGSGLTYMQKFDINDIPTSKAVFSLNNNNPSSTDPEPYFSAQGGIITSHLKAAGELCNFDINDIYSDFGLMAIDDNNRILQCLSTGEWTELADSDFIIPIGQSYTKTTNTTNMDTIQNLAIPLDASFIIADIKFLHNASSRSFEVKNPAITDSDIYNIIYTSQGTIAEETVESILIPVKESTITFRQTGLREFSVYLKGYIK